jgi:hypothetical protein
VVPPPSDGRPDDETESERPSFVLCSACGAKASGDWSFCRRCEASLDDAVPADDRSVVPDESLGSGDDAGCPKCGHTEAEVDDVATTGTGLSRLVDVQNRQFKAVSCTRCGYTEFYRTGRSDALLDLFFG